MVDKPSVSEAEKLTKYDNKLNSIYYGRKKNNLPVPCAHERGRNGTEVCERGIRYELGGADGTECQCV